MSERFTIVGLGEALFDSFPDKLVLGGAPLNFTVHAHQLAQARGGRAVLVARVGQDALGYRLLGELRQRQVSTDFIQSDPDRPTGEVIVELDAHGQPSYQIVPGVAWDNLWFDPEDEALAARCDAVCFGTLAQRDGQSRNSIYRFLDAARRAIRLLDVNLRPPFFDAQIIRRSVERCTVLKLNSDELPIVCEALALDAPDARDEASVDAACGALLRKAALKLVALTRGARGTALYAPTGKVEGEPVSYPMAKDADRVGAGDACSAGLLVGLVLRLPLTKVVDVANHCGAFAAAQPGGVPVLPAAIIAKL
jgi:fructokinase